MTVPKGKIAASMASRGRPEDWANEQESAWLLGMEIDRFFALREKLEDAGFPKKTSWNNKRFIPFIDEFRRRWVADDFRDMDKSDPQPEVQKIRGTHVKGQRLTAA